MARKPTDKQLFKMKNEWLGQFYEEVKPRDFYRAVFPEGSFEREGHPEDEKCIGVLTVIEGEKARNYIVFDELNMVDEVKGAEFAIMFFEQQFDLPTASILCHHLLGWL